MSGPGPSAPSSGCPRTSLAVRLGRRMARWATEHRNLERHAFTLRHLRAAYRTVGGDLDYVDSDVFLYEMPQRKEFFRRALHYLSFNGIDGDYAEFGSFGAQTFRLAWNACRLTDYKTHLWAFDSFRGLPETDDPGDHHPRWAGSWLSMSVDEFHRLCRQAGMPVEAYTTVVGFYSATLAPALDEARPERVSFAYVDCDLHSSTVDVLDFLERRLVPGAVLAFDDWFCYSPSGPSGERLAALEHFDRSVWSLVPFVQYGWHGMSFVVEERAKVPAPIGPW